MVVAQVHEPLQVLSVVEGLVDVRFALFFEADLTFCQMTQLPQHTNKAPKCLTRFLIIPMLRSLQPRGLQLPVCRSVELDFAEGGNS